MTEQYDDPLQEVPESSEDKSKIGSLVDRVKSREFINQAIWSIGSILLALVVAAVIMLLGGYDPGRAFLYLAVGAITSFDQVLWYASPLILAGLSVALAFKCGLFNIGAEGQVWSQRLSLISGHFQLLSIQFFALQQVCLQEHCGDLFPAC